MVFLSGTEKKKKKSRQDQLAPGLSHPIFPCTVQGEFTSCTARLPEGGRGESIKCRRSKKTKKHVQLIRLPATVLPFPHNYTDKWSHWSRTKAAKTVKGTDWENAVIIQKHWDVQSEKQNVILLSKLWVTSCARRVPLKPFATPSQTQIGPASWELRNRSGEMRVGSWRRHS